MLDRCSAISFGLVAAALALAPCRGLGESLDTIVAAADRVRNPQTAFRLAISLTVYRGDAVEDGMRVTAFSKEDSTTGQFRSLVRIDSPPRDAGKLMLTDGSALWFYDPASKASIRISPQQRLLGQITNSDLLTANYAEGYRTTLGADDTISDGERTSIPCWRIELSATQPDAAYFRIEYWIEKVTYHPIKARFYADSGRLLKVAYFRKYRDALGAERPSETVLVDGIDPNLVTRMTFTDWRALTIPDSWFQRDFLPRFQAE